MFTGIPKQALYYELNVGSADQQTHLQLVFLDVLLLELSVMAMELNITSVSWPSLYNPAIELSIDYGPLRPMQPGGSYLVNPDGRPFSVTSYCRKLMELYRHLSLHSLLDAYFSPSFLCHLWHLCLPQFRISAFASINNDVPA